jgi:hypothetical protein
MAPARPGAAATRTACQASTPSATASTAGQRVGCAAGRAPDGIISAAADSRSQGGTPYRDGPHSAATFRGHIPRPTFRGHIPRPHSKPRSQVRSGIPLDTYDTDTPGTPRFTPKLTVSRAAHRPAGFSPAAPSTTTGVCAPVYAAFTLASSCSAPAIASRFSPSRHASSAADGSRHGAASRRSNHVLIRCYAH